MKNHIKRSISIVLAAIMVFSAVVVISPVSADAKSKKKTYYLPVYVATYRAETEGNWQPQTVFTYKYNKKGDLTSYSFTGESGKVITSTFQWTYTKKGKPKKVVGYSPVNESTTTAVYNKKGRMTKLSTTFPYGSGYTMTQSRTYTYDKKGYIKKTQDSDPDYAPGVLSMKYFKNGAPKSIKLPDGRMVKFSKKGLPVSTATESYKYKFDKKGRLTQVTVTNYSDGKFSLGKKYIIKYGKAKTKNIRKAIGMTAEAADLWPLYIICEDVTYPHPYIHGV